ncbi:MAG: aminoacetone oxidase family FAD-binding enzyme [bacterium]
MKTETAYDVIVIGGGPAGMMAAGKASERGLKVLLLEKNEVLGKKLLISGGGRCNLTNATFDTHEFLSKLEESGKFLYSPFSKFGVEDTIKFFNAHGVATKIEPGNRVFPTSDNSSTIQKALILYLKENGTKITTSANVLGFTYKDKKIISVRVLENNIEKNIFANNFILACGGTSHPETGSTGDGYKWLKEIGHNIILPEPSLVPIAIKDAWAKNLQGTTLSDIKLTVLQNEQKIFIKKGRILFTHFGISGPTVINMSKKVGELLKVGAVKILLDVFPTLDIGTLDKKILEIFDRNKNKQFKNCISELIPPSFASAICHLANLNPEITINNITKDERVKIVRIIKEIPMEVSHLLGPENSIVTSGGVDLKEVDFKNMSSKIYPNLYFAGDILNINRPSGGYSLQICWTTGYVAGESVQK